MLRISRSLDLLLFRYKSMLVWGILFVALSSVFRSFQGHYVRDLTNALTGREEISEIFILRNIFFLLLLSVASGIFMFLMRQQIIVMSRHIEYDQKNDIFIKLLQLPHSFFVSGRVGDLMNRIGEDVGKVRMFTGPAIMYMVNTIVTVVTVMFFMFTSSPELSLYVILPLPFLSVFIYFITTHIHKNAMKSQEALSDITALVQESMNGIRIIRSAARELVFEHLLDNHGKNYQRRNIRLSRMEALFSPAVTFLISLTILITLWKGSRLAHDGKIQYGNITEFIFYLYQLTWPFTSVGWVLSLIQRAKASQMRIDEILNIGDSEPEGKIIPSVNRIEIKNLFFNYEFKNIFQGLSLTVEEKQITGITGKTGSGKSTLAYLLARMHREYKGSIELGGTPIESIDNASYRKQISFVFQEPFLFSDTVKNNLLFGCEREPEEDELIHVCKISCIHDEIMQWPGGYEAMIGERGVNLSGGQKQRLCLARALIRKPKILILDDCLSALDSHTTQKILLYLTEQKKHITILLISSRISDLSVCDRIYYLHQGIITASGTLNELAQIHPEIREMRELQQNFSG